jgi:hypothetical protein
VFCVALRCVALRCVALRCVALRCVALRCVVLRCEWVSVWVSVWVSITHPLGLILIAFFRSGSLQRPSLVVGRS